MIKVPKNKYVFMMLGYLTIEKQVMLLNMESQKISVYVLREPDAPTYRFDIMLTYVVMSYFIFIFLII